MAVTLGTYTIPTAITAALSSTGYVWQYAGPGLTIYMVDTATHGGEIKIVCADGSAVVMRLVGTPTGLTANVNGNTLTVSTVTITITQNASGQLQASYTLSVPSKPTGNVVAWTITPSGGATFVLNANGSVSIFNASGQLAYTQPDPTGTDASSKALTITPSYAAPTLIYTLTLPGSTKYPLTIDPTTVSTSTVATPLTRAGARPLVVLGNGNYLLLYHNGSSFVSREGATAAALAAASNVTMAAATYAGDFQAGTMLASASGVDWFGTIGGVKSRYNYASGAWTSNANPTTQGNYSEFSGFVTTISGTTYWYVSNSNDNANIAIQVATTYAAAVPEMTYPVSSTTTDYTSGLVILPWDGKVLVLALDNSLVVNWLAPWTLTDTTAASAFPSMNHLETITGTHQNNLAGVVDSNGNAWMAYNDGTGMQVRCLGATASAWTAKTALTAQASDLYPAMFADTSGNVYLWWIDGGAGNAIKYQKLTNSGTTASPTISLVGSVTTFTSTSATRTYLACNESSSSAVGLVWCEGTVSPYNVQFDSLSLGGGGLTATGTDSATLTDTSTSLAVALAAADSAVASESASLAAATSASDATTLTDTGAVSAAPASNDSGTLTEASSLTATLSAADAGTVTDTASLAASATATDAGTLTDTAALSLAVAASDSATLTESASAVNAGNAAGSDSSTASEAASVAVALTTNDAGTLTDTASLAATTTASDSATLSESASVVLLITASDPFALSEALALTASLTASDTATVTDSGSGAPSTSGSDTATLTELASIVLALSASDAATLTESANLGGVTPYRIFTAGALTRTFAAGTLTRTFVAGAIARVFKAGKPD